MGVLQDEAYASKEEVATAVRSSLQHEMKRYGYEIVNALVTDLQPDSQVGSACLACPAQLPLPNVHLLSSSAGRICCCRRC